MAKKISWNCNFKKPKLKVQNKQLQTDQLSFIADFHS